MSILIPSTEPGVLEDIGSLLTYNPAVEAYEDCESAMEHDGEAWREVWPESLSRSISNVVKSASKMTELLNSEQAMRELYEKKNAGESIGLFNQDLDGWIKNNITCSRNADGSYLLDRKNYTGHSNNYIAKNFVGNARSCFFVCKVIRYGSSYSQSTPFLLGSVVDFNTQYYNGVTLKSGFGIVSIDNRGTFYINTAEDMVTAVRKSDDVVVRDNSESAKYTIYAYSDGELGIYSDVGYNKRSVLAGDVNQIFFGLAAGGYSDTNTTIDSLWIT